MTLLRPIKPFSPENFVSCNKRLNQGSSTCFLPSVPLKTVRLERVKPLLYAYTIKPPAMLVVPLTALALDKKTSNDIISVGPKPHYI